MKGAFAQIISTVLVCSLTTAEIIDPLRHRGGGGRGGGGGDGRGGGDGDRRRPRRTITARDVERVKAHIRPMIQGRDTAHMLRATFHDSVGGSDGCLNRNVDENSGFNNCDDNFICIVDVMDEVYDSRIMRRLRCAGLSRADFYVLAGEVAVENALVNAKIADGSCRNFNDCRNEVEKLDFDFHYGRRDCKDSPNTSAVRSFPSNHGNASVVFDFFKDSYKMSVEETVAILGGHTIGRATGFLGYTGVWVSNEEEEVQFDNFFYQNLVDEDVEFSQVRQPDQNGEPRFQWDGVEVEDGEREVYMMLNPDMAMLKDIQTDETYGGESSCDFSSCADSPGAPFVRRFARSNDRFLEMFSRAWRKMVTAGTDGRLRRPADRQTFAW